MNPRPRYCRPEDRANEKSILDLIARRLNESFSLALRALPAGQDDAFDGYLYEADGKLKAVLEVKRRKGWSTAYDMWHISKDKLDRCQAAAAKLGCEFALVFAWDDGVFMCNSRRFGAMSFRQSGRFDRGDAHDVETMAMISRTVFTRIGETPQPKENTP